MCGGVLCSCLVEGSKQAASIGDRNSGALASAFRSSGFTDRPRRLLFFLAVSVSFSRLLVFVLLSLLSMQPRVSRVTPAGTVMPSHIFPFPTTLLQGSQDSLARELGWQTVSNRGTRLADQVG